MAVVVFGASSQIGHFVLPRLTAAGHSVVAFSRAPRSGGRPGVAWRQGALGRLPPMPAQFDGVASFAPLDALAAWLATHETAPAPALVATSSMSAESKRASPIAADRALSQQLREGEAALAAQCERLGIDFLILRPTLIYGAGLDKSLTPIARRALRWRLFPIPQACGLRQPVHADDIAQAVSAALALPHLGGRVVSIGGGERLPYRVVFERVRVSLPRYALPLPLPLAALRLAARAVPALRGPVSRLQDDLVADNAALSAMLGVLPRGFHPDAATWSGPTEAR
jgi:nucleoside-diphosphate-sugar epimerase